MGMIFSLGGWITRRKQAHLGKPASCMQWDPVKKRYIIDGESESEEEIKAPPPKFKKAEETKEEKKPVVKEEPKEVTGANAFATAAFGGALAQRKRA